MGSQAYNQGALAFLSDKNCNLVKQGVGATVIHWCKHPGTDKEWIKGYMDALIEYMQQNNITEI